MLFTLYIMGMKESINISILNIVSYLAVIW